ncbi:MAG: hypothetical protein V4579_00585 [Pseudomonadota bacterium]
MAMDLIARAIATTAKSDASQALARTVSLDLFTNLPVRAINPAITTVQSSGHSTAGIGAATYVADALATAALAAAHPRLCKQSADGRYFRFAHDAIAVEQAGATGMPGVNDQPAVDAAIRYANAVGIRMVRFTRPAYELWCPARTQTGYGFGSDGYPIYVSDSIALIGVPGGTTLTLKNSLGGAKSTITQTTAWGQWLGGGILLAPNPATTNFMDYFHAENLILDGGFAGSVATNAASNISDKGIACFRGIGRWTMDNCTFKNFAGEILYGGSGEVEFMATRNLTLDNSPQAAYNVSGVKKSVHVNLQAGNSYQPAESVGMNGATFIGGRFYDGYSSAFIGGPDPTYQAGYRYDFPVREATDSPPWVTFIGTQFENITTVSFGCWHRGRIVAIDTTVSIQQGVYDVFLDVESWADLRTGFEAVGLYGPQNLTTQMSGCPAGTYFPATANVRVNLTCRRTKTAIAASRSHVNALRLYAGLYDKDSCHFTISGEAPVAWAVLNAKPASFVMPLIELANFRRTGGNPLAGVWSNPSAAATIDVNDSGYVFQGTGVGPWPITLSTTYGYADGQKVAFEYDSGTAVTFAATGAGMKLAADRKLATKGDRLTLRYSSAAVAWVEDGFVSAGKLTFTGSATYDAPSIAAAGTATTTVTATGASLGDYVERISLGVSAGGLVVTGYVSAANTVTVVLFNPTAGAVDLASTTLSVEVRRK